MSTHSYIGVIEEDGTLKYVYCHSDGYPSYLGRMLLTYYNTPELATGLAYGCISCSEHKFEHNLAQCIRNFGDYIAMPSPSTTDVPSNDK